MICGILYDIEEISNLVERAYLYKFYEHYILSKICSFLHYEVLDELNESPKLFNAHKHKIHSNKFDGSSNLISICLTIEDLKEFKTKYPDAYTISFKYPNSTTQEIISDFEYAVNMGGLFPYFNSSVKEQIQEMILLNTYI